MLCILSRSKKCLHSIWTCILMFSNYSINICTIREWRKGNFFSIMKKERLPHSSCFERETCFKAGKQSAPWVERTPPWTLLIEVWWTRSVEAFSLWPSQICRTSSNGINILETWSFARKLSTLPRPLLGGTWNLNSWSLLTVGSWIWAMRFDSVGNVT